MNPMCVRNRFTGFAFILTPLVHCFQGKEETTGLSFYLAQGSVKNDKNRSPRVILVGQVGEGKGSCCSSQLWRDVPGPLGQLAHFWGNVLIPL